MSSTNKTPNYGLPQYTADDKPTYLGDFNKAMLDIDTAMKNNADAVNGVTSSVETAVATSNEALTNSSQASEDVATATTTATQAKTIAQNAQTTASNAQATASNAESSSEEAITKSTQALTNSQTAISNSETANSNSQNALQNSLQALSKLEVINDWDVQDVSSTANVDISTSICQINKAIGLLSLFGNTPTINGVYQAKVGTLPSYLRPKMDITLYNVGSCLFQNDDGSEYGRLNVNILIKTDGSIMIPDSQRSKKIILAEWNTMVGLSDERWTIT